MDSKTLRNKSVVHKPSHLWYIQRNLVDKDLKFGVGVFLLLGGELKDVYTCEYIFKNIN
jgi:hypothetical protein